jgi:hypothetical protein
MSDHEATGPLGRCGGSYDAAEREAAASCGRSAGGVQGWSRGCSGWSRRCATAGRGGMQQTVAGRVEGHGSYDSYATAGRGVRYPSQCPSCGTASGRLPERPKGAVCKTVGLAYVGSNPTPATTCGNSP